MRFHAHSRRGFGPANSRSIRGWQRKWRRWDIRWDSIDNLEKFLCTNHDSDHWPNRQTLRSPVGVDAMYWPSLKLRKNTMTTHLAGCAHFDFYCCDLFYNAVSNVDIWKHFTKRAKLAGICTLFFKNYFINLACCYWLSKWEWLRVY